MNPGDAWPLTAVYDELNRLEATIEYSESIGAQIKFPGEVTREDRARIMPHVKYWREQILQRFTEAEQEPTEEIAPEPIDPKAIRKRSLLALRNRGASIGRPVYLLLPGGYIEHIDRAKSVTKTVITGIGQTRKIEFEAARIATHACVSGDMYWLSLPCDFTEEETKYFNGWHEVRAKAKARAQK